MEKSLIYYSDNRIGDPICSAVRIQLSKTGLPITSVTLKPIAFGKNLVAVGEPGPFTMMVQILIALENADSKYVFFCEHDVLYPLSHFDFTPPRDDIFYYNENIWRWDYPNRHFITYDRLISLSSLCCNRDLAIKQYRARVEKAERMDWDLDTSRDPEWARLIGFEPGTKKKKRGGFSDDDYDTWRSKDPLIDIRHNRTYSRRKCTLGDFKHKPLNWRETDDVGDLYGLEYTDSKQK